MSNEIAAEALETQSPAPKPAGKSNAAGKIAAVAGIAVLGIGAFLVFGMNRSPKAATPRGGAGGGEAVPVVVGKAMRRDVPVQLKAIGNVEAASSVAIQAQVTGQLQAVHFQQGQDVRKGDLLFTLDARPLQAALDQAKAQLAKDTAAKAQAEAVFARDLATNKNAQAQAERYRQLYAQGLISLDQMQQYAATADSAAATIEADRAAIRNAESVMKADQAAIANAQTQLSFATIRSPVDGRTGTLQVFAGSLIKSGDATPLVTINQISPIFVTFSVPEKDLERIRAAKGAKGFTVAVAPQGGESRPMVGDLFFIDNAVDLTTGTIKLKAKLANVERALWPGQFANVTVTLGAIDSAVVVPSPAVQIGQDGPYVYVVKADQSVELRKVKAGAAVDGVTVIEQGLAPDETVVTDGQLRLVPGAKVATRERGKA